MKFETLHLCNIEQLNNINQYIQLISKNDAVIFYSEKISTSEYEKLNKLILKNPIYFVITQNINKLKTISYDEWLYLVNNYQKTFTWK